MTNGSHSGECRDQAVSPPNLTKASGKRIARRLALFSSLVLLAAAATAQVTDFLGSGRSQVKGGDTLAARDSALAEARRKTIERAVLEIGGSELLETSGSVLGDEIYPNASTYIGKTSIASEGQDGDSYRVSIRAAVDLKALRRDLKSVGAAPRGGAYRPKIMVLVDEYFGTDSTPRDKPTLAREVKVEDTKKHAAGFRASNESSSEAGAVAAEHSASGSSEGKIDASAKQKQSEEARVKGEIRSGSDRASGDASASRSSSSEGHVKGQWKEQGAEHDSGSAAFAKAAAKSSASAFVKDEEHFAMSVKEYFPDSAQIALPESSAAAEISSLLLKDDFNLVDKAFVQQLREEELGRNGYMVDYLRNNSKVAIAARKASQKYGADYLVIGACNVVYRGLGEAGQQISGANLILKVVNTSTGQVVAAVTNSEPGMSGDVQSSRFVAAKRVGTTVGEDLASQLLEQTRNRARAGIEIDLKLYGIPDLQAKVAFGSILEGLDGVQSAEERAYDRSNRRIEYQVTYRGTVTQFKNGLFKRLFTERQWQSIDEQISTGNNVNLVLKTTK